MKVNLEIKDGHVSIPLDDLFYMIHEATEDEFDANEFIERLGWVEQIRKKVVDMLKDEFSRDGYNQSIHEEREELLEAMGKEEIKYYAHKLAKMIESSKRWEKSYYKLYHYYQDRRADIPDDFAQTKSEDIDFDYRRSLEKIFGKHFEEKLT